jgi:hypothetical protein
LEEIPVLIFMSVHLVIIIVLLFIMAGMLFVIGYLMDCLKGERYAKGDGLQGIEDEEAIDEETIGEEAFCEICQISIKRQEEALRSRREV